MEWLDMEIDNENRDIRFEARASEGNLQVSVQWGSMDQQDDFVAYCNWWIWTPSWFIISSSFKISAMLLSWSKLLPL
mgnify:CR=1 FL=1